MAVYNQNMIIHDGHVGYGTAISVAIFLIISFFVVIYVTVLAGEPRTEHRRRDHQPHRASRFAGRFASAAARWAGADRSCLFWLLIVAIAVYALFPFYWAMRSAYHPDAQLFSTPIQYFPSNPTLGTLPTPKPRATSGGHC